MSENPYASPRATSDATEWNKPPRRTVRNLLIVCGIIALVFALLLPFRRNITPSIHRTQCKNNLKQIALALHNYHDDCGALPPAYTIDANGKPLHSWRTLILPYLEQQALYNTIDLSKPWNHPVNSKAFKTTLPIYRCPASELPPNYTSYLASVGENSCFHPTNPRTFSEFTDGTSNTLMVVEFPNEYAVHWMSPLDADEDMIVGFASLGKLAHTGGTQVALADSSVRFLSDHIDPQTLLALFTVAGGETVGEF